MSQIKPVLEPAAREFVEATANPPYLFNLSIKEGRKTVDSVQDGDIPAPPAHDRLVRELTTRAEAATVFVNYSLSVRRAA